MIDQFLLTTITYDYVCYCRTALRHVDIFTIFFSICIVKVGFKRNMNVSRLP